MVVRVKRQLRPNISANARDEPYVDLILLAAINRPMIGEPSDENEFSVVSPAAKNTSKKRLTFLPKKCIYTP